MPPGSPALGICPAIPLRSARSDRPIHYSAGLIAEKLGFPLASVKLVPLQSMSNIAAAVKGNQVDAGLLPATIAIPLVARAEAHMLGWVGDETPWQLGAIFATQRTLADRRAVVAGFLKAYRRGAHDFYDALLVKGADGTPKEGPQAEPLLAIIAKHTGQAVEQIRFGILYVDPDAKLLVADIYRQVAWYQGEGLVDKAVDAKTILDLSFIEGAGAQH
jgi:NitT/TauT family transport system substrate-binding protein